MALMRFVATVLALLVAAHAFASAGPRLKHVAVLGDGAALGAGPSARLDAWPDQMGRLLGPAYAVRSFVRQSSSADPKSTRFVGRTPEWEWLKEFDPDVVVLALGSADASNEEFPAANRFGEGIDSLIDSLSALPRHPRIVICLPPPCAPTWSRAAIYRHHRVPVADALRGIAARRSLTLVDLDATLAGLEASLVEGVVADPFASERIAITVATAILGKAPASASGIYRPSEPPIGLVTRTLVAEGVASGISGVERWQAIDGALVGQGGDAGLGAMLRVGEGPFRMRIAMTVDGGEKDGPQVVLDEQFLLLENSQRSVQLNGELFRGRPSLAPSLEVWKRGVPIEVEVRRAHHDLEYWIDGKLLYAVPAPGRAFDVAGIVPRAAKVTLHAWTIEESPIEANGIPTMDVSVREDRRTIVDRRDGQYLGHPSTVTLADGKTMLCAYPLGHGQGAIVLRRSVDGGITWSEPLETPANWSKSLETPTLFRLADPTRPGASRLILFSGLFPARIASSDDDGATWTPLAPIGAWGGIVVMSSIVERSDGSALAFFHDDGRFLREGGTDTGKSTVYASESRDGGRTWSEPRAILHDDRAFLCEPGVIRSPDGKRLAMLLRENARLGNSMISFSDDEGTTWSNPREVPATLTGDRHVPVQLPDGRILVSMRDMAKGSATYGDWIAWLGTWEDLESGELGQCRIRFMDNHDGTDCGYAGIEVRGDTIVATSYGHWAVGAQPYVIAVRIPIADLPPLVTSGAKDATTSRP